MPTPLYKSLNSNGTTQYVFPSVAEKLSASHQNTNVEMYFSNFVLLNFPAQNLSSGTNSSPIYFDFVNSTDNGYGFHQSIDATPPTTFKEQFVESLRNYVANEEETMRISRLNNQDFYYDNNSVTTPSEKLFFKWAKKLNLIDFEPANNGDQYIGNLTEFDSLNSNDVSYFNEILWTERQTNTYDIYDLYQYGSGTYSGNLYIAFQTTTNFKVGDIVIIDGETNAFATMYNGMRYTVQLVLPATALLGQQIILNTSGNSILTNPNGYTGNVTLVYNKLIQAVGEIAAVNNVQDANQSYTEIYAMIPAQTGQTPDILFRTMTDVNYKPNLTFPILPSQYQPEIIGAEVYTSPIVSTPQNYPGSYYAQFDTTDFTYTISNGDSLRRSGDYYGIYGDINNIIVNSSKLDGISIDFDPSHYAKMNIYGKEVTTFNEFNAMMVNNQPPKDYTFNAILWYYTYKDINGNIAKDLYGISLLDNPDNNPIPIETSLRFPAVTKLVATNTQQGTSYDYSLNLNYNIINENPIDLFNPNNINNIYSFNEFNEAMRRLIKFNDVFESIVNDNLYIKTSLSDIKQLVYTQTDINTINNQINNLNKLLTMYQTNQLLSSNTIEVTNTLINNVPMIQLNNIDTAYNQINTILTSNMYSSTGATPLNVTMPNNKDALIIVENNDQTNITLSNNNVLSLLINKDLNYKQSLDIIINGNDIGSENKQFKVYINYTQNGGTVISTLIDTIDLPIFYNKITKNTNIAKNWKLFNFDIDINNPIRLNVSSILEVPLNANYNLVNNSINSGDTIVLNDFTVGTSSNIDLSGQYTINSVGATNSYLYVDISTNPNFVSYGASSSIPFIFNDNSNYLLNNNPYISLNKGIKYKITRVDNTDSSNIADRYLIQKFNI